MDYEQFYRYLDSRPPIEIAECLRGVAKVARKHSGSEEMGCEMDFSLSEYHRLQIAEQVWFQNAVWNKFGANRSEFGNLSDLRLATSSLFSRSEVGSYLVRVNTMIHSEAGDKQPNPTNSTISRRTPPKAPANIIPECVGPPQPMRMPQPTPAPDYSRSASTSSDWMESSDSEIESASGTSEKAFPSRRSTNKATSSKFVWTAAMVRKK